MLVSSHIASDKRLKMLAVQDKRSSASVDGSGFFHAEHWYLGVTHSKLAHRKHA